MRRGTPVWTASMSVRSSPSLVNAAAQPRRASTEHTQCSPADLVIFVSAMVLTISYSELGGVAQRAAGSLPSTGLIAHRRLADGGTAATRSPRDDRGHWAADSR